MLTSIAAARLALAASVTAVEALRAYYLRRSSGPGYGEARKSQGGDVLMVAILSACWYLSLALFIVRPSVLEWASISVHSAVRAAGAATTVGAIALLYWVHNSLGSNFSSVLRIKSDHQLVQTGPYGHVRHPMYSAFWLLNIGYLLLSANLVVGASGTLLMSALSGFRVPREERQLADAFGAAYTEYCERTGRLVPRLRLKAEELDRL